MSKEYVYSEHTYNSKNPLVRFSHRKRFLMALNLILENNFNSLLDYGTGDGHLLKELKAIRPETELNGFEPVMHNIDSDGIKYYSEYTAIGDKKFDVITCFEVLEHFNESGQKEILNNLYNLLNENGILIISVPIEIYLPSLVKNLIRIKYYKLDFKYVKNIFKAVFGQNIPEIRNVEGYIPSHMGFDHRKLERLFKKNFNIKNKLYSPLKKLPVMLNSQVFYKLEKLIIKK
jgi:SAM-dependent methyltransferase